MLNKKKMNQKGFTLVELIIVIAILGILVALFVPRIMGNVEDARKSKEISNARTIASEITSFNAKEKAKTGGGSPFGLNSTVTKGDLATADPAIRRAEKDFPDDKVVLIKVDSAGNATIEIQP